MWRSYALCTEVLGIKWRAVLGIATQYYWSGGIALMAPVAYMMPRWRSFATFCGLHGLAYILLSCRFLLESPLVPRHGTNRQGTRDHDPSC